MNPFSGMLGDYGVVMGNTGGDNRVEFGTRIDHSIWYESPKFGGVFSFDVLFSPGQNRTPNSLAPSSGSPDCNGGNEPGSGNLPIACDDGGYGNAFSVDLKFEAGPVYVTAAYEMHKHVNRNSDGVGSNNPYYGYLMSLGNGATGVGVSPLLDWASYEAFAAEYPEAAPFGTPEYSTDIADESAFKVGAQYMFDFGLDGQRHLRVHEAQSAGRSAVPERAAEKRSVVRAVAGFLGEGQLERGLGPCRSHAGRPGRSA